jgi:hypothetical protein
MKAMKIMKVMTIDNEGDDDFIDDDDSFGFLPAFERNYYKYSEEG